MDDPESCYFRQGGGKPRKCSEPGCTRTDAKGMVKKMMGDTRHGSWYCPIHWRDACLRDFDSQCFCTACSIYLLEGAAQDFQEPAHPTYQVSCSRVLRAASEAPVANLCVVSHVSQCAVGFATPLGPVMSALKSLGTVEVNVFTYGSQVGGWAIENSDLDLVVVLRADVEDDGQKKALTRAFLSLYFLEASTMDDVTNLQDLVEEKETVSYWQYSTSAAGRLKLKVDISAVCCPLQACTQPSQSRAQVIQRED